MDWFERLTGFREGNYEDTRRQLDVRGTELRSRVNGRSYGIGNLELPSLDELRERARRAGGLPGRLSVRIVIGDARQLHHAPEYAGALFQVASQFNMLEMVSPNVTPEHGVTRYERDRTQGPACAMAAGAATIYRNYFAPIGNTSGQTASRQLDGLADIGVTLADALGRSAGELWTMRNGYALGTNDGLDSITRYLGSAEPAVVDALRGKLRIGVHSDVEVTDADGANRPRVSQALCSALPVSYSPVHPESWQAFARFVLEGAYEATMWAAVENAQRGASNIVLLTLLGGGAFGNDSTWIHDAMRRALSLVSGCGLDVRIVSYRSPSTELVQLAEAFA